MRASRLLRRAAQRASSGGPRPVLVWTSSPLPLPLTPRPRPTLRVAAATSYIIDSGVCYLVLTERSYPKRLAFNYLEELQKEFNLLYAGEVDSATRPYAFIKFDAFIQKTKRLYVDTRAQRNVNKLNEDLADVQKIMMTNIQEVLGRGERLDSACSRVRRTCRRLPASPVARARLRRRPPRPRSFVLGVCARRRHGQVEPSARRRPRVCEAGEVPEHAGLAEEVWTRGSRRRHCSPRALLEIPMIRLAAAVTLVSTVTVAVGRLRAGDRARGRAATVSECCPSPTAAHSG